MTSQKLKFYVADFRDIDVYKTVTKISYKCDWLKRRPMITVIIMRRIIINHNYDGDEDMYENVDDAMLMIKIIKMIMSMVIIVDDDMAMKLMIIMMMTMIMMMI